MAITVEVGSLIFLMILPVLHRLTPFTKASQEDERKCLTVHAIPFT